MCYGDPSHGSDGYYEAWLREREEAEMAAADEAARAQAEAEAAEWYVSGGEQ
jgi:hypothetical protein